MICVYALVSPPVRARLSGLAGERLRSVQVDGIAAIVGDVRRRPTSSRNNLRKYAAVVERIAARTPAILPVRFGTTFDHSADLTTVLQLRRDALRARLHAIRGRVQMTIRLISESESGDASRSSQSHAAPRSRVRLEHGATQGTQYLQQRVALAQQMRQVPELAPIRAAIQRLVKDERVERRSGIVTVHHLVPRGMADRYRAAVARAADDVGMRIAVTGPWAPYAFADNW